LGFLVTKKQKPLYQVKEKGIYGKALGSSWNFWEARPTCGSNQPEQLGHERHSPNGA